MADTVIATVSKELYRQPVKLTLAGVAVNPSSLAAKFAFLPTGTPHPEAGDFLDAIWETEGSLHISAILVAGSDADQTVNPAAFTLTGFDWFDIWWSVSSPPELMVRKLPSRIRQQ